MPIFMKYQGIVGPMKGKRAGWIALESCQMGTGRDGDNSDIAITKRQDTASTALFREASSGTGKNVTIDFTDTNGGAYITVKLEDAMITGISVSGSREAEPFESLSLNFGKISYVTKPAGPAADANAGNTQAVWNSVSP